MSNRRTLAGATLFATYLASACAFTAYYRANTIEYPFATLGQLTSFEAHTPYQYRTLVPAVVRVATDMSGIAPAALYWSITALTSFALLFVFRAYLALFLPRRPASAGALLILYALAWNTSPVSSFRFFYPSDVPSVLFVTAGLVALVRNRRGTYYAVFLLACLNRETSCFLTFAYLFTALPGTQPRSLIPDLSAQLALWCTVKLGLYAAFSGNDGTFVDVMFERNLALLTSLATLQPTLQSIGILSTCGFLWILIPLRFREQPVFLKRALLVLIPFYAGMLAVANLDELRIYDELAPILTAPAVVSLCGLLGLRKTR